MKLLFVQAKANKDIDPTVEKSLKSIPEKKIGLLATVQFTNQLEKAKKILEANNKIAVIGKPGGSASLDGQVLGCDVSAALNIEKAVDCFLYIGTGEFHPLGVLSKGEKPVYVLDPFTEKLREIPKDEKQKLLKKQALRIAQFKGCKVIGILVSTKSGQHELQASATNLKGKLEKLGKIVYIFMCDSITNSALGDFSHIDAWVNTACPRIVEDEFEKPIVNAIDLE